MSKPWCQHGALQDDRHQAGTTAAAAQHGPVRLRHVDQADGAGPHRHLAPARAEPHLAFDAQGDLKVIHRTAGDVRGRPVVFLVGRAGIDQQRIAGHHRHGGDMEVVLRGERNDIADVGRHGAQLPQRVHPAPRDVRRHGLVHGRLVCIAPR
ncbi:hypothetical protein ABIF65_007588 [Bradyrhizobium japonicum]